jgi:exosortase
MQSVDFAKLRAWASHADRRSLTINRAAIWRWASSLGTREQLCQTLVLVSLIILLYASVLVRLAARFSEDPNYSHGFAIPVFSTYLIWLKRDRLARTKNRPSMWGLLIVAGAIVLLYLGNIAGELFLTRISLVVLIFGMVLYFWGWPSVRLLAFPLCFLLLMIPIPAIIYNQIVFPLQLMASRFATATLETIRVVPVLREGNLLILPNCTLEVVEACSGVRFLMSLLALALGYAYLTERSVWIRSALTAAMVPVAIIGNGLRVVISALFAHYRGVQSIDGVLHPISGVVVFLVAVVSLLVLHSMIATVRTYPSTT